jgi:hypothetical protein
MALFRFGLLPFNVRVEADKLLPFRDLGGGGGAGGPPILSIGGGGGGGPGIFLKFFKVSWFNCLKKMIEKLPKPFIGGGGGGGPIDGGGPGGGGGPIIDEIYQSRFINYQVII